MKRIGLYGYGFCGKTMSESFYRYWGGEYEVTAIFDREPGDGSDPFWNIPILPPDHMKEAYESGVFDAVMVCIRDWVVRGEVNLLLEEQGIPLFFPGREEDIVGPEFFLQEEDPDVEVCREGYSFHVYRNIYGAKSGLSNYVLLLFNDEGKVNADNYKKYFEYFEPFMRAHPFRLRDTVMEKVFLEGDWCSLLRSHSSNFGHFTMDIADGAYLLETAGFTGKYLYNEKGAGFIVPLLQMLGVSSDRLVSSAEIAPDKVYVFERLFNINHDGKRPMEYSPDVLPEMGAFVRRQLTRDNRYPKKVYVKRIGVRKLLNGDGLARQNGYYIMTPEEHSLQEQMQYFFNADIVVCPHGANSSNFLYMRPGTVFAEIFSDRWHMDVNSEVCEACGVHYLQMTGHAVDADSFAMHTDYTVDEDAYQKLIDEAERLFGQSAE